MTLKLKHFLLGAAASAILAGQALAEKIIIGHFGNPTPMQLLSTTDELAKATGWEVEWRKFDAGTDVIAAMASGDVVLSELGSSPIAIGTSSGLDIQLIAYSDVIGKAESLIARNESGITSVADLKGKTVGVPIGSTAHYSLMGALQHEGLSETDVNIVGMKPDDIAAAWGQGTIDAAWVWQPVQAEILKTGTLVMGADQTAEWGFPTYDGWVVNKSYAEANPDKIVAGGRQGQRHVSGRQGRLDRRQRRGEGAGSGNGCGPGAGAGHPGGLHLPADRRPDRRGLAGHCRAEDQDHGGLPGQGGPDRRGAGRLFRLREPDLRRCSRRAVSPCRPGLSGPGGFPCRKERP